MLADPANAFRPAASVPKPMVWANITATNSAPVSARVPIRARGMLRCGSVVSSPIETHASKPAQHRNAATTPPRTAATDTPEVLNTPKSTPVGAAPPRAMMTADSTTMARIPKPSIASRILASTRASRPVSRSDSAPAMRIGTSHGSW